MEEHTKKNSASKLERSAFPKQQIVIFLILAYASFIALGIYGFVSLRNRLKHLEEATSNEKRCLERLKETAESGRAKRSIKTNPGKILERLKKLEGRFNQSYRSVGRQPAFVLRGPPGKPGRDGIPGVKGRDGRDGRDGARGPKGNQGASGQRGPQGPAGQKGVQGSPGVSGVSYIRWGKKTCPHSGATLVYEGLVGGGHFRQKGSGADYVCLPRVPIYAKYVDGVQNLRAGMYGAEYQSYSSGIFPSSLHDHEVPCVRCHVATRATQMMIPGRNVCPAGWTREYKGYLMAEKHDHHPTMYTCVDEDPDYIPGTHANLDGTLFHFVEGICGSLPCRPYVNGRELTCAVCTR